MRSAGSSAGAASPDARPRELHAPTWSHARDSARADVGLGLVTFVSVLAAGTKATIDNAVHRSFAGNLIIENTQGQQGIPGVIAPAIRRIPGVGVVTAVAFTKGTVRDLAKHGAPVIEEAGRMTAIEPESFPKMYKAKWEHGSNATLASLGQDNTVLSKKFAKANNLQIGQRLKVLTPANDEVTLTVTGILKEEVLGLLSNLTISRSLASSAFGQREDGVNFVTYALGADTTKTRAAIDALLHHSFPQARSQTAAEFTHEESNMVNTLLVLVYVLLTLSVVVSLFGIVNTLILSIYERTHELGMMRAIGTSRRPDSPNDPLRVGDHGPDRWCSRSGHRRRRRRPRHNICAVRIRL